jgi:hypothetical protein
VPCAPAPSSRSAKNESNAGSAFGEAGEGELGRFRRPGTTASQDRADDDPFGAERFADAPRLGAAGFVEVALRGAVAEPHPRRVARAGRRGVAEQRDGAAPPRNASQAAASPAADAGPASRTGGRDLHAVARTRRRDGGAMARIWGASADRGARSADDPAPACRCVPAKPGTGFGPVGTGRRDRPPGLRPPSVPPHPPRRVRENRHEAS